MTSNLNCGTKIRTHSGLYFDLAKPDSSLVRIEDIAHALSQISRFVGHTPWPYSVAQHSVIVGLWCEQQAEKLGGFWNPKEAGLRGLLHDAHEAYVGDWSTPLKNAMSAVGDEDSYSVSVSGMVGQAVRKAFQLPPWADEYDGLAEKADQIALATEVRDVLKVPDVEAKEHWQLSEKPWPNVKITLRTPQEAKELFLQMLYVWGGYEC